LDLTTGWGEPGFDLHERMTIRPALTINGMRGGYLGAGGKSIIPSKGVAKFSLRLVPDQTPQEIAQLLQRHILAHTHPAVQSRLNIRGGSPPVLLSAQNPATRAAARAVTQTWHVAPIFTRSGGTIPFVEQMYRYLRAPIILLGFGLADDNIHAPNEKIDLSNFFRGIETVIRFLAEYGDDY
jgi:acetylornithine deacetylase/succinyl-diaminopimelate desuccinylase-like protein